MDNLVARTIQLALGTAQWGGDYGINNTSGPPEPSAAQEMLRLALRTGITTIDTARGYGDSEALIGASLHAVGCGDSFRVVTKLHPDVTGPDTTAAAALANTGRSLSESRHALRRDKLDVVMLHRQQHLHAHDGRLWRRLRRQRELGLIGALGVSSANPSEAWAALEHPEIEIIQVAASLLDQRLARRGFFEAAQEAGKQIYLRSIFLQGLAFIQPRQLPDHLRDFTEPLLEIRGCSTALECSVLDLFVAYAATLPGCTVVVGCETVSQLRGIIAASEISGPSPESLCRLANRIVPMPARLLDPAQWREQKTVPSVQPVAAAGAAEMHAPDG